MGLVVFLFVAEDVSGCVEEQVKVVCQLRESSLAFCSGRTWVWRLGGRHGVALHGGRTNDEDDLQVFEGLKCDGRSFSRWYWTSHSAQDWE